MILTALLPTPGSRPECSCSASVPAASIPSAAASGIGPAGDRFEQEADRTAERVARSAPVATGGGADFSHVRVHADERAARSADEIGALAYTAGPHIVFGP